jgi:glycerol kinase
LSAQNAGGVTCVPAFAGLGAPFWRPEATASFTGLTLATHREHLVISVLEGLAAQIAELVDSTARDLGQRLTRLRVDGGLTKSMRLMQVLADVAQVCVEVYPTSDATPLGAAALARMALDPTLGADEAIGPWQPSAIFEPAWSQDQAGTFRARWNQALNATLADQGKA